MNISTIVIASLSGALGAIIASIIAASYQNRREKNLLVEKWMNNFRDEISKLCGYSEQLRLINRDIPETVRIQDGAERTRKRGELERLNIEVKSTITAISNKIKLLVYHEKDIGKLEKIISRITKQLYVNKKKQENQDKQKSLERLVDDIVKEADKIGGGFKSYDEKEQAILQTTKDILKYHWGLVQKGLSVGWELIICILIIIAIILCALY